MLEAAAEVARAGTRAAPPVPPPAALRPYLAFRRLSGPALDGVRRALDQDEAFRQRVAAALLGDEPQPGTEGVEGADPGTGSGEPSRRSGLDDGPAATAAVLVLRRPAGWQRELEAMVATLDAEAGDADARARAERLEAELDRGRGQLEDVRAEVAGLHRQLQQEREARREADGRVAELGAELAALRDRAEALDEDRRAAIRELKEVQGRLAERQASLRAVRTEVEQLRADLAQAAEAPRPPAREGGGAGVGATAAGSSPPERPRSDVDPVPTPGPGRVPGPVTDADTAAGLDRRAIADTVAAAAAAAGELARALAALEGQVAPPELDVPAPPPSRRPTPVAPERPQPGPRRRAPRLPLGMFDDDPAAVWHLARLPGAVVLVDGYNVSLSGWTDESLSGRRHRLVDGLSDVANRTGCDVVIVFDGAEVAGGPSGESRLRGVQVRFTAPGVEADDVLLDMVERYPLDRPVTVVSSDRRVADGARRRGAAVLASATLRAAL